MKKTKIILLLAVVGTAFCVPKAWAAKNFTITLVNAPVAVTMGDPAGSVLTYQIKNTNTGGDSGNSINQMEFNLNAPYTWSNTTTAPAGWSITTRTTTKIIFTVTANTTPPKIATGSTQNFSLILGAIPSGAQDSTDLLRSAIATYDDTRTKILNNPASSSWTRKSLSIDSFTAVDSVTGQTASSPGRTLTVTLTVTNRSTTSPWSGIVAVCSPASPCPGVTQSGISVSTGSSPSTSINAGLSGTLVWSYTIASSCGVANPPSGTVFFTVNNVRNSTSVATSKNGPYTTATVNVGCFSAVIAFGSGSSCAVSGETVDVKMTLTNQFGNNITGATATLTPAAPPATKTYVSGPTPASVSVSSGGGTATIDWFYTITGTPGQTYIFTGSATGTLQSSPTKSVSTPTATSATGKIQTAITLPQITGFTTDRNQNVTVGFSFSNTLCANAIKKVAIILPAGWSYLDSSALITNAGSTFDDWTSALSGSTVTFTYGTSMTYNNLGSGDFVITFTQIPSTAATYTFPMVLTQDVAGDPTVSVSPDPTVKVDPPGAGAGLVNPKLFKENY
jgi:hypothetical protein